MQGIKHVEKWFKQKGWKSFAYQHETWKAYLDGKSGLVHAPTGTGKTYSVLMGPLIEWMNGVEKKDWNRKAYEPFTILWITPLRALANDTVTSIRLPLEEIGLPWTVEARTGDTSSAQRASQKKSLPSIFVTTPESLALMESYADWKERFKTLKLVVVDEWHELIGSKRGVQTELGIAGLRTLNPKLRIWGLSATLGNLEQAKEVLVGPEPAKKAVLVSGKLPKSIAVDTLIPEEIDRFPWSGHLGFKLLPNVVRAIESAKTTLLFTNTRSQAELWYQGITKLRPDWGNTVAIHHGSIDRKMREEAEMGLASGVMRCVVATSSLDLGVDFSPVDQVIQVGSPKGIARLMQRAGRSGHRPGETSRVLCVPTNAFELVEFAAVKDAITARDVESQYPIEKPLDLLVQHVVTVALGGGFREDELYNELRTSFAYRDLTREEWHWVLDFVTHGGEVLKAYPEYHKVVEKDGVYTVEDRRIGRFHRLAIGTITSDSAISVKYMKGGSLGSVEESFIARFKPGDRFIFAGIPLELIRIRDMAAYVKRAPSPKGAVPQWMGGRLPISSQLTNAVKQRLSEAKANKYEGPEMEAVKPILEVQREWSVVPEPDQLLLEFSESRDGQHLFVFPFEGRLVHEGLAALAAYRIARDAPHSITLAATDYGFELLSQTPFERDEVYWKEIFSPEKLTEDLLNCLNSAELARRQFREIARIAGLVFSGYPGSQKSVRQIQASSGLFYDVFAKYDPSNLLLIQAKREVFERQLEVSRLERALHRIANSRIVLVNTERLTPLAFPIWATWMQGQLSSERWSDRVKRMAEQLETSADKDLTTEDTPTNVAPRKRRVKNRQ